MLFELNKPSTAGINRWVLRVSCCILILLDEGPLYAMGFHQVAAPEGAVDCDDYQAGDLIWFFVYGESADTDEQGIQDGADEHEAEQQQRRAGEDVALFEIEINTEYAKGNGQDVKKPLKTD